MYHAAKGIVCFREYSHGVFKMISKALVAASTKPMILAILVQGENYGYQIIQRVKKISGGQMEWSDGMLYPVLHRMEKDGLIVAQWIVSDGKKLRKYYRLTAEGQQELEREKHQWFKVHDTFMKLLQPMTTVE
jgi:DNA-binding PadR family transcriptional regulator